MRGSRTLLGAWLALLLVVGITIGACQRRTRYEPMRDSTGHVIDSAMVQLREVQELWESGSASDASEATALALFARLRKKPATEWRQIADSFLDSLGVGSENASADCALMVNFFARSDPSSGSWPYLYWCGEDGARFKAMEGRDLRLFSLVSHGFRSKTQAGGSELRKVAALFGRRAGGGHQPLLMEWTIPAGGNEWKMTQTLGADSLGGTGTGEFESVADTTVELVLRTYRTPGHFDECATCPHVFELHRFRWTPDGFQRVSDATVPSPYASFVAFIRALMSSDEDAAEKWVLRRQLVDAARKLDWGKARGNWRIAPAGEENPHQMVFFRGQDEAYRVEFERSGDVWLISGFEPVQRTVE